MGFPGGSAGKESACNAGDLGSIPGLGRSPGEGKYYPLQYSWRIPWTVVHGVAEKLDTTVRLSLSLLILKIHGQDTLLKYIWICRESAWNYVYIFNGKNLLYNCSDYKIYFFASPTLFFIFENFFLTQQTFCFEV